METLIQAYQNNPQSFYLPLGIFIGSIILGLILENIIISNLILLSQKHKWKLSEILAQSLKGIIIVFSICFGIYAGILGLPFQSSLPNLNLLLLVKQVLLIIVIGAITIVVSRIASGFIHLYTGKLKNIVASTSIFTNITNTAIFIVGILIALDTLGISVTPVLAALGVGGLAVALALQDSLSNLFSGLQIIAARQVKPGDLVKTESGDQGHIKDITWRNTTIKDSYNNMIIIPNFRMASSTITNYSQSGEESNIVVEVGVSYENDIEKVEKIILETAEDVMANTPGGVPGFKPFIRYSTFAETGLKFNVTMSGQTHSSQFLIKHDFLKKLIERFKAEHINITTPAKPVQFVRADEPK